MKTLLIILIMLFITWKLLISSNVILDPGIRAPLPPYQSTLTSPTTTKMGDYKITELANFSLTAKVLGKENYFFDQGSDLSPIDLALGWGRMSDESVISKINISQSGRWYRWNAETFPIPRREIETHSANMHMIPANDNVKKALKRVKKGQIIQLFGSLVKVESSKGWRWKSSLTREDTGGGACELVWVKDFKILI
ncbi:hypothetical protein [Aliikangiella sp. IMCC44359]|uniref:hypothetical protein n=1 Tax=Aliikangiella sp. IMCC44359 TaxID=3459125 RepID=UPI00403B2159